MGWTTAFADRFTTVAIFAFFTSLIGYSLISSAIRSRHMRQFARERNLAGRGDLLPERLFLSDTSFAPRNCSISNCLEGSLRDIPLAIFDLSHRMGKSSVSQTIVAFPRSGSHAIPEPPIDAVGSYQFDAAGDWIIGWIPRRTVKVEELEDWCIELHKLASDLLAEAKGDSKARPRLFRWLT
jgi:hypothetical protein